MKKLQRLALLDASLKARAALADDIILMCKRHGWTVTVRLSINAYELQLWPLLSGRDEPLTITLMDPDDGKGYP